MKPKDLKWPFNWEERRPQIADRVFFIPQHYDRHREFVFPDWSTTEIFGRTAPLSIEYCTGNGAWIIDRAQRFPERNWVAVEKKFERVRKIWSKMCNLKLDNLFIVYGEALLFTRSYVSDSVFDEVYINFPDPWPKPKHAKHRLLQEPFLTELARTLRQGGHATIVTDDAVYVSQICTAMRTHACWQPRFADPYFICEWEDYGTSYFDALWRQQKRTIHYMQFGRR